MADLRRMFYNRYKTSSIFCINPQVSKPLINYNPTRDSAKNDNFVPKYSKMTSKERYWHEMRYKEFGRPNNENKNTYNIIQKSNKTNKNKKNSQSKLLKRNHSIKEERKKKDYEKKNNLKGAEIMCRDMYNGYDPKEYKFKRSKSLYNLRSYSTDFNINEKSSRQERNLAYTGSNIFFDKSKDIQIQKSYDKFKKNKSSTNLNNNSIYSKSIKRRKSMSDFEKELNEKKSKFSHSRFATDTDWKTTNTEELHYDNDSDYWSISNDSGIKRKSFRRVNILKREMTGELNYKNKNKNKNKDYFKESVKYNLLSGEDKKNELSTKIYNNHEGKNNKTNKTFSRKKYDFKNSKNIDKYNPTIEYYEIDIPRNFDLTDLNTIRNFFTNKGLHAFKLEECTNSITNQSGKITLRIRKDNILDEKEYQKNLNKVKKIISQNDMKLYKVEGNKAKVSTLAKQRVKTPYKGELLLKPSDTQHMYRNYKKNGVDNKKVTVKTKGTPFKRNNKTPAKREKVNTKK